MKTEIRQPDWFPPANVQLTNSYAFRAVASGFGLPPTNCDEVEIGTLYCQLESDHFIEAFILDERQFSQELEDWRRRILNELAKSIEADCLFMLDPNGYKKHSLFPEMVKLTRDDLHTAISLAESNPHLWLAVLNAATGVDPIGPGR